MVFLSGRKGAVEIQFNWIFILIVGAIILIFFISIVTQQSKISGQRIAASVSFDMGLIFSGAQVSTNTEHLMDIPPFDIHFECDNDSIYSSYRVSDSEVPIGDSLIVFSPDYVLGKSRKMLTWSKDWNVPFRVTNFLYITTPFYRYVVVNGTNKLAGLIYDGLPEQMVKGDGFVKNISVIKNQNDYKLRIIKSYDNTIVDPKTHLFKVPSTLIAMDDDSISLLYINPSGSLSDKNSIDKWGELYFYEKNGSNFTYTGKTYYISEASLYGAIYTEDINKYDCNMNKSFKRLHYLIDVYRNRADDIISTYQTIPDPQNCKSRVQDARNDLIAMGSSCSVKQIDDLYLYALDLKSHNKNIQRFSCPVIY